MFGMPNGSEWLIVLLLILIVFGAGKLPEAGRQMGRMIENLREPAPIYSQSGSDTGDLLLIGVLLVVSALACVLTLVLAQAGWV